MSNTTHTTHPYFTGKAEAVLQRAGGSTEVAGPLAAWAESAHADGNSRCGVVVAEDGSIVAETRYVPANPKFPGAWYVHQAYADRYQTPGILDLAMAHISRGIGQPVIHVTFSDVCTGARETARP